MKMLTERLQLINYNQTWLLEVFKLLDNKLNGPITWSINSEGQITWSFKSEGPITWSFKSEGPIT